MTTPTVSRAKDVQHTDVPRSGVFSIDQLIVLVPFLCVLALFMGYLAILLIYGQAVLRFPFDYDQGEGFELYDAVRLARGQNIYLDNAVFPFYSSNYPPVFRLILTPLVWLFGPHLWVGRAVALACTLILGALIFLAARRQLAGAPESRRGVLTWFSLPSLIALLAALAFCAANYVYQIAPLARAHLPMVMFAFAGIYCLDRAFEGERAQRGYVIAGVALLIVAGLTKLQAIDALAAGFGYLLLRKPRWLIVALVISALSVAALVVVLNLATQGQFWLNVVLANVNEYDINQTWKTYEQWFQLQGALIVCSMAYVVWDVVNAIRARSFKLLTIWSLYFVAGSAMGMLTGKWGAGPTYLIAAIAASCVCTVALLGRIAQGLQARLRQAQPRSRWAQRSSAYLLSLLCVPVFLVQAGLNVHLPTSGRLFGTLARVLGVAGRSSNPPYPYYDGVGYTQLGHLLDSADVRNGWELVRIAQTVPGPVWSEEAMLTLLAGKDVVTNPTQLLNLSKSNMLDTSEMLRMINAREFGAVIFRAQFYPQDVLIAIGHNYRWARTVRMNGFDYQVLLPKP
jgi:4-amino-4-deoxy-L-arabinose transferase-like glycosyltransferase